MTSEVIYEQYGQELYFFILKKARSTSIAHDIFQNVFLKIHQNLPQARHPAKLRAWVYQISRNEIANYFNKELVQKKATHEILEQADETAVLAVCCFDKFIDELPKNYKEVMQLIYFEGKKQEEVADGLSISLANVKARVRRSKALLKEKFVSCCKYEVNDRGRLIGSPDCPICG